RGRYVVKDPRTGAFFSFGEQEHFLLLQLDGRRNAEAVCMAFEGRFGEPLPQTDLDGFLELARKKGLLQLPGSTAPRRDPSPRPAGAGAPPRPLRAAAEAAPPPARPRQSLLYWRKSVFDPDRLFTWLAPAIAFVWTRLFLLVSGSGIVLATVL